MRHLRTEKEQAALYNHAHAHVHAMFLPPVRHHCCFETNVVPNVSLTVSYVMPCLYFVSELRRRNRLAPLQTPLMPSQTRIWILHVPLNWYVCCPGAMLRCDRWFFPFLRHSGSIGQDILKTFFTLTKLPYYGRNLISSAAWGNMYVE